MLLSSSKGGEKENFTVVGKMWEIHPTVPSLVDNQLSSAFSTQPCLSWAPSCTSDRFILQQGLDIHYFTLARDYFGQFMIKRIFLAGFCRQNVRGFVSESEIELLFREFFWSTPCNIRVWSCWVYCFWLVIKWVLILDWEPQHPCMGSVTLSCRQRRCTMKLAGLLPLEAVLAWRDWNQSWVLMPWTGVTQVTTPTTGLLLSTAALVCAPGRSWVG